MSKPSQKIKVSEWDEIGFWGFVFRGAALLALTTLTTLLLLILVS
jgi:hypothetical protein